MYYKISKEAEMAFDSETKDFTAVYVSIEGTQVTKDEVAKQLDIDSEYVEEISEQEYIKNTEEI